MKVVLARTSGFCNGVKRAMRIAVSAARTHGCLQADGPLVHNRQALYLLAEQGISDAMVLPGKPILIRAHGVTPERRKEWTTGGREIIDATCPHVAANQRTAAKAAADGRRVVLAGDKDHAEVQAVAACSGPDCLVAASPAELEAIPPETPVHLLAQTTFGVAVFAKIAAAARRRFADIVITDSICRATHDRQTETTALARSVEAVVVVGGRNSANTRRLADTAKAAGVPVFAVETGKELAARDFAAFGTVGVTAGASTPDWVTQEVVDTLRCMGIPVWRARLFRLALSAWRTGILAAVGGAGLALALRTFLQSVASLFWIFLAAAVFFAGARLIGRNGTRAIPGTDGNDTLTREIVFALAGVLVSWLPAAWGSNAGSSPLFCALSLACAVVWGGLLLRDSMDPDNDRLLGRETPGTLLGVARTRIIAIALYALTTGLTTGLFGGRLAAVAFRDSQTPAGWFVVVGVFAVVAVWGLTLSIRQWRGRLRDMTLLGISVDCFGIAAGAAALLGLTAGI